MKFRASQKLTALTAAALLAIGLSACGDSKEAAGKDTWKDYAFLDGSFSIRVPSDPACQQQDVGKGISASLCSVETGKTGMLVSASKLPGVVPAENIEKAMVGAMDGSAKSMQGTVVNPTDVTTNGLNGKDFSIKTSQGDIRSRLYIKGSYLIQALAMPKGEPAAAKDEMEKFVTSLSPKAEK